MYTCQFNGHKGQGGTWLEAEAALAWACAFQNLDDLRPVDFQDLPECWKKKPGKQLLALGYKKSFVEALEAI